MIVPVQTREDLLAYLAWKGQMFPERRTPIENVLREDAALPTGTVKERFVYVGPDGVAGTLSLIQAYWMAEKTAYQVALGAYDPGICERLVAHALKRVGELGGHRALSWVRDSHPASLAAFEAEGFARRQNNPEVRADLAEFDPAAWPNALPDGLEMATAEDLRQRDPDWMRRIYAFDVEATRDIPFPEPIQMEPFEDYERGMATAGHAMPFWRIALDGREVVGISMLFPSLGNPEVANTGLTAVKREYRRRGIATVLKAAAMANARNQGIRFIFADNEENNPMRDLNLALGFRTVWSVYLMDRAV